MVAQDNLRGNVVAQHREQFKRVAFGTPLENSSIDRGQFRVGGSATLLVDGDGGMEIDGRLRGEGSFHWLGPQTTEGINTSIGIFNQNGPWNLAGTGGITGNVSSTGAWTQTGTYTVTAGGKIVVQGSDPMTIGQTSAGRPGIQFSTGAQVVGTSDGAQLNNAAGNGFVYANDTVGMQRGSKSVEVTSLGVTVSQPFKIQSLPIAPAGATVYMVVADSTGNLYRKSTSA